MLTIIFRSEHCYANKWYLLSPPNTMAGPGDENEPDSIHRGAVAAEAWFVASDIGNFTWFFLTMAHRHGTKTA
jgi:hypothetical protein